jgi:MoCo/4Fe-4S cofactor protein with predicted Tat translocation signal
MKNNNTYWKGVEELEQSPEFVEKANAEFADFLPVNESNPSNGEADDSSRRDFLKLMGFGFAAATLVACEAPVRKIIPYVNKPIEVEPGRANYYASSYVSGSEYASIVVKTREGRPIKIEGNTESTITQGGVNTQIQASVLSLYDIARRKKFSKNGADITRKSADKVIIKGLKTAGKIAIVSESVISPTTNAAISEFKAAFGSVDHIQYDPISASGIVKANKGVFPNYRFAKADVVVGFSADFLSGWGSSIEYTRDYAAQRKVRRGKNAKNTMNKHYQFETMMSLTGANADERIAINPSEEPFYIANLYNLVAKGTGNSSLNSVQAVDNEKLKAAAKALLSAKGKSLVICSSNDEAVQILVRDINAMLSNVGTTVDLENALLTKKGDDAKMNNFIKNVSQYDAVIILDANPVYNHPRGAELAAGLAKVKMSIAISDRLDETSSLATFHTPSLHNLESWGDALPKSKTYSIVQPTITPIFENAKYGYENRAAVESLLTWAGNSTNSYDLVRKVAEETIYPSVTGFSSFEVFWIELLKTGVAELGTEVNQPVVQNADVSNETESEPVATDVIDEVEAIEVSSSSAQESYSSISSTYKKVSGVELVLFANQSVGAGHQANNPWLQEVPDSISKVCWDNYIAVSPIDMRGNDLVEGGLEQGDVLNITLNGAEAKLPVVVQPGQKAGTIAVALGYGRTKAGQLAAGLNEEHKINAEGIATIGSDVYDFVSVSNGTLNFSVSGVTVAKAGSTRRIAQTQTHHTIMGRDIVREATIADYNKGESKFKEQMTDRYQIFVTTADGEKHIPNTVDIWAPDPASPTTDKDGKLIEVKTHLYPNHHWGMVIDMNSCIGCSACIVGCQVENNIPVVGKDEVIRRREMHWMRIDRYYTSAPEEGEDAEKVAALVDDKKWTIGGNKELEKPSDYPARVTFQPMLCQHCNHATCESVCPVMATSHSSEGLNQMAYNRCIGTRYCANNCAYKVRRFNWFNYSDSRDSGREFMGVNVAQNDDLAKMVLNPDVMVRARGVIEKCSMCVQRIQSGKLDAKLNKRTVNDGEIQVACAQSCPADAITFGDMNDPKSKISVALAEEAADRKYHVLEELNVKPNVSYLTKIRNI